MTPCIMNLRMWPVFAIAGIAAMLLPVGAAQAAPMAYETAVTGDNPFAYYRMDEPTGTTAVDETGNHNATYVGGATLGQAGMGPNSDSAVSFDGSNDAVKITDGLGNFVNQMSSSSIEFVFKTTESRDTKELFGYWDNDGDGDYVQLILNYDSDLPGDPTGRTMLYINTNAVGGDSDRINGYMDYDLYDGEYHHMVFTYDATGATPADRLKAYVDGVQQTLTIGKTGAPSTFAAATTVPVGIAARGVAGGVDLNAGTTIAEAAVYTQALSAAQVQAHYNALVPEPGSLALLGLGGLALLGRRRRAGV